MAITVKKADITKVKNVDLIVNAANGIGVMGAGVAGAIRNAAGEAFAKEVRKIAMASGRPIQEGEVYLTPPGNLSKNKVQGVLHAVTMVYPGGGCSYATVEKCLTNIFKEAIKLGMKSVAIPGLGTGIGNLDPNSVARRTVELSLTYADQLDIQIVDIDERFISAAQKRLESLSEVIIRLTPERKE